MSRPSDYVDAGGDAAGEDGFARRAEPKRPGTPGAGAGAPGANPRLGPLEWVRYFWRQLTSMSTALILLLLLAVASVPGSLVPQRSSDPNGVIQYFERDPAGAAVLDALQAFDVYSSVWFSAIYILLFVSLIGCIIPRTRHHWEALRAEPPRTPSRLNRFVGHTERHAATDAATAIEAGAALLAKQRYRVRVIGAGTARPSVSAERGYLRETGNLVFHSALVGVLVAVGVGGGLGYNGQALVVEGDSFVNTLNDYDSFTAGRFFVDSSLAPYSITLDDLDVQYYENTQDTDHLGTPIDYTASVTVTQQDGSTSEGQIKVNHPLNVDGDDVYLLGNGYAVDITVQNPDGETVFASTVPFLSQDTFNTSLGVIKVPDGLAQQVGMVGFLYPTPVELTTGAYASIYPDLTAPLVSLQVYVGDLGLDTGTPVNVYQLDTDDLTEIAGVDADEPSVMLDLGDAGTATAELPDGLGTITVDGIRRYAALEVHSAPSAIWVLVFALLSLAGLLTSLFIPRRRIWIAAAPDGDGVRLQYAGLARGEDPGLEKAVAAVADAHAGALGARTDPTDDADAAAGPGDRPTASGT